MLRLRAIVMDQPRAELSERKKTGRHSQGVTAGYVRRFGQVGGKMEPLGETRESQRATAQAFE
jgi:hypothetical protein